MAIYPVDRTAGTETAFCPIDVMRETLGVGACQYLLDIEGLGADGDITPQQTAEWVLKTFERKREGGQVAEIRRRLDAARRCVAAKSDHMRAYEDVVVRIHGLCKQAKGSGNGEAALAALWIDEYVAVSAEVSAEFGKDPDLTGVFAKTAASIGDDILQHIGKPDALTIARMATKTLHGLGENRDMILAAIRMEMRVIKQRARDLADSHPQAAEFLGKVRAEAEGALRKKPSAAADRGDGK
jgi:hypothetical protein